MLISIIKHLVPNFILVSSMLYIYYKLFNKKINFKNYKLYITLISVMLASALNYIITNKIFRIVLITFIFMIFVRFLFRETIQKCIITPIFYQLIVFVSEFCTLILINLFWDQNKVIVFFESFIGICVMDLIVAIISILIIKLKFVKKLYRKIETITNKVNTNQLLIMCMITMLFFNIFVVNTYYKFDIQYWIIANMIFILVLFAAMIFSLKTQNNYNKVSDKYNIAIKSLNDFEEMMSKYRVANHENKNLLLTIRAMILDKEKNIPKYIDSIIEEKFEDDEKLLFEMAVIPTGGLRATIYSSILKIKDNNIKYDLIIDRKIKTVDLIELDTNTTIDICKIIGVFIDNAIDETKKLEDKNIIINLYVENKKIYVKISNRIKGKIEIDRIYDEGYTTKSKGHGYGLALAKQLVNNNNILENKLEYNNDIFSQILVINNQK